MAPFELVMKDSALQENWFRRIVALVIDGILLVIISYIIWAAIFAGWMLRERVAGVLILGRGAGFFGFGLAAFMLWIIAILYFSLMESYKGASVGKMAMSLKVVGENGEKPAIDKAFIRNVSRIHWILFVLDLIGGLVLEGDPRQRFTDRMAKTVVYHAGSTKGGPFAAPKILTAEEAAGASAPAAPSAPQPAEKPPEQPKATEEAKAFCRHCGAPVQPDSKFCPKCGKQL